MGLAAKRLKKDSLMVLSLFELCCGESDNHMPNFSGHL